MTVRSMKFIFAVVLFSLCSCATTTVSQTSNSFVACKEDKPRLELRAKELQSIVTEDQAERRNFANMTNAQMVMMAKNDETRRMRIGEIFGEGCFTTAQDYAAAALVYQHGTTPDHFFQTYIWSKRAVELGDKHQARLMALGIDRYLVNVGQKQLFASQATKEGSPSTETSCWCLQDIEESFPDRQRKEVGGQSLDEAKAWVNSMNEGKTCPKVSCNQTLKPTPKGSVPGLW